MTIITTRHFTGLRQGETKIFTGEINTRPRVTKVALASDIRDTFDLQQHYNNFNGIYWFDVRIDVTTDQQLDLGDGHKCRTVEVTLDHETASKVLPKLGAAMRQVQSWTLMSSFEDYLDGSDCDFEAELALGEDSKYYKDFIETEIDASLDYLATAIAEDNEAIQNDIDGSELFVRQNIHGDYVLAKRQHITVSDYFGKDDLETYLFERANRAADDVFVEQEDIIAVRRLKDDPEDGAQFVFITLADTETYADDEGNTEDTGLRICSYFTNGDIGEGMDQGKRVQTVADIKAAVTNILNSRIARV
jgi:hypothetical protein